MDRKDYRDHEVAFSVEHVIARPVTKGYYVSQDYRLFTSTPLYTREGVTYTGLVPVRE